MSFLAINKGEIENVNMCGQKLYHYTSISALCSILSTNQLWFSYTKNMNDRSEVYCFLQRLTEAINQKYPQNTPRKNEVLDLINKKKDSAHAFVMCFSSFKDNAAQWERYADNARGVCIQFDTTVLSLLQAETGWWLQKAYYYWDVQSHEYFKYLSEYIETGTISVINSLSDLIDNLGLVSLFHKHSSFESENEARLIMWYSTAKTETRIIQQNNIVKKFQIFDFKNYSLGLEDLIDEIIIGPRSQQSVEELQLYVDSLGFHKLSKKIRKSDCPLR